MGDRITKKTCVRNVPLFPEKLQEEFVRMGMPSVLLVRREYARQTGRRRIDKMLREFVRTPVQGAEGIATKVDAGRIAEIQAFLDPDQPGATSTSDAATAPSPAAE